jgi:PiT family inorganic phosphate transporter
MSSVVPAALILVALVFNFLNGLHDSANIVATAISSRALPGRLALVLAAAAEFCGPFIFGVAVATTIGKGLVVPGALSVHALFAALLSGIGWNVFTWWAGIPSSSSHALVGGLVGAALVQPGWQAIKPGGLVLVLSALLLSPVLGLAIGYLFTRLVFVFASHASPRINVFFQRAQIITAVALALSHGANDAQKTMGIVALGLVTIGTAAQFDIPVWLIALCGGAMALGTATGGWRLIKTLGARFYRIRPVHGFSAQLTATGVILGAAMLGGPVSTTQVVSCAILGAGSAERINKVRWGVARQIAAAWLLTIPCTALVSAGLCWVGIRISDLS